MKTSNFIRKAINNEELVVGLFLDRNILIKKLENAGPNT